MSKDQSLPTAPQVEPVWPEIPPLGPLLVSIYFSHAGLHMLRQRIERDINAKGRGISPIPFTVLELLDLERLLLIHPDRQAVEGGDNVSMSHDQRQLLAIYVTRYYNMAVEVNDTTKETVYLDCLDALTLQATLLIDFYIPRAYGDFYGLSDFTRPLVLLGRRFLGLFDRRGQRSLRLLRSLNPAQ